MEEAIRRGLRIPGTTSDIYNPYRDGIEKGSMESFHEYLKLTLPKGWTADPAHIKLIAEHLDAVDRGQIDRLAISMPPRHGKTETTTVRYGAYAFEKNPRDNVLVTA